MTASMPSFLLPAFEIDNTLLMLKVRTFYFLRVNEVYCYHFLDLQSDTASMMFPEIELELVSGTLGGLVTAVEGLII